MLKEEKTLPRNMVTYRPRRTPHSHPADSGILRWSGRRSLRFYTYRSGCSSGHRCLLGKLRSNTQKQENVRTRVNESWRCWHAQMGAIIQAACKSPVIVLILCLQESQGQEPLHLSSWENSRYDFQRDRWRTTAESAKKGMEQLRANSIMPHGWIMAHIHGLTYLSKDL